MVSFPRRRLQLKNNFDKLELFVKNSLVHNMSALHKRGILELKNNYARLTHGSTGFNQGAK